MRILLANIIIALTSLQGLSQSVQLYYDLRHTVDPGANPKNFPALSFEYFKEVDTLVTGSFLFKLDSRLDGEKGNMGQVFTQVSQTLRFWKPRPALALYYSGGLGVTSTSYGYYLTNAFGIGSSLTFRIGEAWLSTGLYLRTSFYQKNSFDPQFNIWFGRGFPGYRIYTDGSFVIWTENRDHGTEATKDEGGKKLAFFGDPKIWIRIRGGLSAGLKVNIFYNLSDKEGQIQFYPAPGVKYQF